MFHSLLPLSPSPSRRELAVLELGVATAGAVLLAAQVVETAGAVFASQTAYAKAFGGIVWDMLLLGEGLSPLAWGLLSSAIRMLPTLRLSTRRMPHERP